LRFSAASDGVVYSYILFWSDAVMASEMCRLFTGLQMLKSNAISLLTEMMDMKSSRRLAVSSDIDLSMNENSRESRHLSTGISELVDLPLPDATEGVISAIFLLTGEKRSIPVTTKKEIGFTLNPSSFGISDLGKGDAPTTSTGTKRKLRRYIPSSQILLRAMTANVIDRFASNVSALCISRWSDGCARSATTFAKSTRIRHRVASRFEVARRGYCACTQWPHFSVNLVVMP